MQPEVKRVEKPFALMGYFLSTKDIYKACEALRDAGYTEFDAHTPFPVHGLEKAIGLKPTKLPWLVLLCGLTGLLSGIALTYYVAVDYPLNISGKESFSYQTYIPVFFELTILFSGIGCFLGLWGMNKLPEFFHPAHTHPSFGRASDDAFFIAVETKDPKYDPVRTKEILEKLGARELMEVAS